MTETSALDLANDRLGRALDALDAALARRIEAEAGTGALAEQLHAAALDRAQLAAKLDESTAHARLLQTAARAVSGRVDHAIEAIRAVIEPAAHGSGG